MIPQNCIFFSLVGLNFNQYNQYKSNKRADIIVLKLYYQAHAPDTVLLIMKKGNPDEKQLNN